MPTGKAKPFECVTFCPYGKKDIKYSGADIKIGSIACTECPEFISMKRSKNKKLLKVKCKLDKRWT